MVLKPRTPAKHNEMLGWLERKTPVSAESKSQSSQSSGVQSKRTSSHLLGSTSNRPTSHPSQHLPKRLKLSKPESQEEQAEQDEGAEHSDHEYAPPSRSRSPLPARRIIPDSDAESGDEEEEPSSTQRTDIEQALPQIKTDRQAIEEYETLRAAEGGLSSELQQRLGQRQWIKGKSSIYVDAFNLALETVLEEESHLFDGAEMGVFEAWRVLGYEAQYLYVRLFLRKTSAWFRIGRLGYYSDIADMNAAIKELYAVRMLPERTAEEQVNPGELAPPEGSVLEESFTFADNSDEHINTLEEASSLLLLDELKAIAKEARVQGKNKSELLKALRRTSGKQTGLGFASLQRTDTEESVDSITSDSREESPGVNRDAHFLRKIMSETGPCIRISLSPFKLFERVHLVFYRSTEWTEKSLTTIILARIARRNFPQYIVSRSATIFPSRSLLLEFEAAIRTQFRIDSILEFNGRPTPDHLQDILDTFEEVLPRWRILLREEQLKEDSIYATGEGAYLRRLSPAWVYTRIVHKGAYVLGIGKIKQHLREHEVLTELLNQRLFHASRRGAWYQRKALLEEHYMGDLHPSAGRTPEEQKKHWKRVALQTCEQGLQDNLVHLIYHYDLQKRVTKLEKSLKVAKRFQHDFGHARLAKPAERTFYATRIERNNRRPSSSATTANNNNTSTGGADATRRGAKTIWLDPADPTSECSVEAMCLSHYRALGYKGFHSEGGILRTLFALLFYDILFTYVPNVFQTPFQTCPLDLHTDGFYAARMSEINARLAEIANEMAAGILGAVWEREAQRRTCVVGLDWTFEKEDLLEIVGCFEGEQLATLCKVMAQEYAQRGGGVPDLFLWKVEEVDDEAVGGAGAGERSNHNHSRKSRGEILLAEVKSENDRLSDTQRLWIHVLTGAGVKVELCNALAAEVLAVGD